MMMMMMVHSATSTPGGTAGTRRTSTKAATTATTTTSRSHHFRGQQCNNCHFNSHVTTSVNSVNLKNEMCNRICGYFLDACQGESGNIFTLNNHKCHSRHHQLYQQSCHCEMSTISGSVEQEHNSSNNNIKGNKRNKARRKENFGDGHLVKDEQCKVTELSYPHPFEQLTPPASNLHHPRHQCNLYKGCCRCYSSRGVSLMKNSTSTVIKCSSDQESPKYITSKSPSPGISKCFNTFNLLFNYNLTVILITLIISLLTCASALPSEAGIRIKTSSSVDDFTIHGAESAIVGSPVRLPCDVSISTPEDSITLILWYRGDRKSAPIYSVDARSGNLANAKHHSAESLKSRIKFELNPNLIKHNTAEITSSKSSSKASHHSTSSTSRAYLTLDPILMEDEGIYLCRVDFKWSRTMNTVTNLTVVYPPTCDTAAIDGYLDEELFVEDIDDNFDYEDTSVNSIESNFKLLTASDSPYHSITNSIDSQYKLQSEYKSLDHLHLPLADENDLEEDERVNQQHQQQKQQRSSTASIKLVSNFQFNPSSKSPIVTTPNSKLTSLDSMSQFEQTHSNSDPLSELFMKSLNSIQSDSPTIDASSFSSTESFKSLGKVVKVIPGKRVKLRCKVNSKPSSVTFNWSPIDANVDVTKLTSSSFVNSTGGGISSSFFTFNTSSNLNGQQLIKQSSFTSSHLNTAISLSDIKSRDEGTLSELTFIPIESRKKQSQLACWANNEIGHQRNPCIFTIVLLGAPDPVESCIISNLTWDSIHIECSTSSNVPSSNVPSNIRRKEKSPLPTPSTPLTIYSSSGDSIAPHKSSSSSPSSSSTVVVAIENTSPVGGKSSTSTSTKVLSAVSDVKSTSSSSSNHHQSRSVSTASAYTLPAMLNGHSNKSQGGIFQSSQIVHALDSDKIGGPKFLLDPSLSFTSHRVRKELQFTKRSIVLVDDSSVTTSPKLPVPSLPSSTSSVTNNGYLATVTMATINDLDTSGNSKPQNLPSKDDDESVAAAILNDDGDDESSLHASLLLSNLMQVDTTGVNSINHNLSHPSWQFTDSVTEASSPTSGKSKSPQIRMKGKMRKLKHQLQQQKQQPVNHKSNVGGPSDSKSSTNARLNGTKLHPRFTNDGKRIISLEEAEFSLKYRIEVYDSEQINLLANVTNDKRPSFWINGLLPSTKYVLLIYAENYIGRSDPVLISVKTADLIQNPPNPIRPKGKLGGSSSHNQNKGHESPEDESVTRATLNLPLMTKSPSILIAQDEHSDSDSVNSFGSSSGSSTNDVLSSTSLHSNSNSNQLFSILKKEYFVFLNSNSILILIATFSVILPSIMLLFIVTKIIKRKRMNQLNSNNGSSGDLNGSGNSRRMSSSSREAIQLHHHGTLTGKSRRQSSVSITSIDQATSHSTSMTNDGQCSNNKVYIHDSCDLSPESAAAEHLLQLNTYLNSGERLLDTYHHSINSSSNGNDTGTYNNSGNYYTITSTTTGTMKKSSLKKSSAAPATYLPSDHSLGATDSIVIAPNEVTDDTNNLHQHHHHGLLMAGTCDCNTQVTNLGAIVNDDHSHAHHGYSGHYTSNGNSGVSHHHQFGPTASPSTSSTCSSAVPSGIQLTPATVTHGTGSSSTGDESVRLLQITNLTGLLGDPANGSMKSTLQLNQSNHYSTLNGSLHGQATLNCNSSVDGHVTYYTLDQSGRLVPTVTELTPNYLPSSSASPTASSTTSSTAAVTNGMTLRNSNTNTNRLMLTSNQSHSDGTGLTNGNLLNAANGGGRYCHPSATRCLSDQVDCESDQIQYLQPLNNPFDPDLIQTHLKHRQIQTQPQSQLVVNTYHHQLQHQPSARFYETSSVSPGSYCDNCTGSTGGSECESTTSIGGVIDSSSTLHRHSIHPSTGASLMYHHANSLEQILSSHQASIVPSVVQSTSTSTSTTSPAAATTSGTAGATATATLDAASVAHLILASTLDTVNASPLDASDKRTVTNGGAVVDVTGTPLTDCSCGSDQLTNSYDHSHGSPHHALIVTANSHVPGPVETSPVSIIRSSGTSRKSSKVAFVEGTNGS